MESLFEIKGIVVITGAAGLLGQQHAKAVLEHGGIVALIDINKEGLERFKLNLKKEGFTKVHIFACDITKKNHVQNVLGKLEKEKEKIVGLINNAAINPAVNAKLKSSNELENFNLDVWDLELDVGIKGSLICTMVFGGNMAKNKYGSIVNISSDLGLIAPDQRLYSKNEDTVKQFKPVTYSVIKHALIGLTKYTSTYWNDNGIRCNALLPGGIQDNQHPEFLKKVSKLIPLGRMANKDEYQGAIVFLLSDASSYMTGSSLIVDGGRTSW
jgi:NAD(P)-dependent dehydrogenase (short-subunit alcohol dehydrogenase family)